MSIDGQVDKEDVHIYNGLLLNHKKDEILPFGTAWMDLDGITRSDISQMEKDKYLVISLRWNRKIKRINRTQQKQTHIENRLAVTKGEGSWE